MPKRFTSKAARRKFLLWLYRGEKEKDSNNHPGYRQHPWWQVMCLTGVDYFSTLGYQPGIAFLAAGALSPIATLILVLLTLFGALPVYNRVARESPHGEGSISMLEHLLPWWQGKLFVLALLGFLATDFIITITLSAADATAHLIENPFVPTFFHNQGVPITLILSALLGAVFLKGFKEAIGIAVGLVALYLTLNAVVIAAGIGQIETHPHLFIEWKRALFTAHGSPLAMLGISLLLFPKLALGLSGFETGVAMMPLVKGEPGDDEKRQLGKIRNILHLIFHASVFNSVYYITSAFVTTLLIPVADFRSLGRNGELAGPAHVRRLAYLAHR